MSQSRISTSDDDTMMIDAGEPERDLGRHGGRVRAAAAGGAADQQHGGQGDTEISRVVSIISIISVTSIISITSISTQGDADLQQRPQPVRVR